MKSKVLAAVRAHERPLAAVCLFVVALITAAFFVPPFQSILMSQVERVADYLDNRWWRELQEGERLVAEERYEEAVQHLERLAARFPARNSRHARTLEMQRVLDLLGRSQQALGRKARTLDAYRQAVLHDPRNYSNHFRLAQAALELNEPEEALREFEKVLSIHPAHVPSLEGVIRLATDGEDAPAVVEAYERYLDALVVRELEVRFGDLTALVPIVADGRFRIAELVVPLPEGWSGELALSVADAVPDVERIELHPPLRVGEPGTSSVELPVDADLQRSSSRVRNRPIETYRLVLRVPPQTRGVARVILRVRLLRPVHAEVWRTVEGAYATVLDRSGAAEARRRSYVLEGDR